MPEMFVEPRVGNTPASELTLDGWRIEFPVSVPVANIAKLADTAVALPPDDPPGLKAGS